MDKKVLFVEDEDVIREMAGNKLKREGYEVFVAADGVEALELVEKNDPDLIITDVVMPRMDGYEFFKSVRSDPSTATIPFIILTARGMMEDAFLALGAEEFIAKPFAPEDLSKLVSKALKDSKKEYRQEVKDNANLMNIIRKNKEE